MNHSTQGLPVHHQLPEFTQTHVHWVGDAIQPSHPLSSPSPPAPNPSQHQGLFQWVNSVVSFLSCLGCFFPFRMALIFKGCPKQSVVNRMDDQAVICMVHNPTDVLEFLHKKPVDCLTLLINSAWTITFMLRKQINIVLICDSDRRTFLELWFLELFNSRFWHLLFRSYWKYQVSSSFYCPQKHIPLSSFSWKVRINVKSSVFLFTTPYASHSLHGTFALAQIFFWNEAVSWFLNTGKDAQHLPNERNKIKATIILCPLGGEKVWL